MSHCGMRQMEERHVCNQVELMVWCSRLDLLALSNFRGEVQVHRLNWQKVWSLPPTKETSTVCGMAWRPDGKVLAIGYSCGVVALVDVEDREVLHSFTAKGNEEEKTESGVTCLSWCLRSGPPMGIYNPNIYNDASQFLSSPPVLNNGPTSKKTDGNSVDFKQLKENDELNILVVGYANGELHLKVFGKFPCGVVKLKDFTTTEADAVKIINAELSDDFSMLKVFYIDTHSREMNMTFIQTSILSAYSEELFTLATKYSHIINLLSYMDQTMALIIEAWEHILLEMDSKMAKYAAKVPEGGVSADLLHLLMYGVPSDELEIFLLQDLTAKGLKKFGSSVELSYSTIQKLVLKQLNIVGQNLTYYLAELRGLSRIADRFVILGLEETAVTASIHASNAFLNKCLELQQVIHHSMRNYKAFFRWLFVVIVRLLDEQAPSEIVKITQQDVTYIAEFLHNFDRMCKDDSTDSETGKKTVKFNLERLAQYLSDKELTILPDDDDNPWMKFLNDNPCIYNESESIINMAMFRKFSLVQQEKHLKSAVDSVFKSSDSTVGSHFSTLDRFLCLSNVNDEDFSTNMRVTQIFKPDTKSSYVAFVYLPSGDPGFYFYEISTASGNLQVKAVLLYFCPPNNMNDSKLDGLDRNKFEVTDLQFYSMDVLSVLLQHEQEEEVSVFVQLPVKAVLEHCKLISVKTDSFINDIPRVEAMGLLEHGVFKVMDKMAAYRLAVSGGRKVAVVLSKSCRKVRVFEMEVDGDDEEEETLDTTPQSQSTTQHSDTSQQNISLNDTSLPSTSANASIAEDVLLDISEVNLTYSLS